MENLKESGIPNLVSNEGGDLVNFESEKRGELFGQIKEKREVRDELLKESDSFKNKLLELIGNNQRAILKSRATMEQRDLYSETNRNHQLMRESIKNEMHRVIQTTVTDPLLNLKSVYRQREYNESNGKIEDVKKLELRFDEEKAKDELNIENLQTLLSFKETRKNTIYNVLEFFTERGNYVLPQNIEKSWDEPYSYRGAKGVPIEIAHAVNESMHEVINNDGVSSIEDSPNLFHLLNETIKFSPDSLTEGVRQSFVDFMLERGVGLEMRELAKCNNLLELVAQSNKKEEFNLKIKEKVDSLIGEKQWDEVEDGCRSFDKEVSTITKESLNTHLATFGIQLSHIERSWGLFAVGNSWGNLRNNIEKIETLEQTRPGIAKTLLEGFGIKEFRRYPTEVLIKQYDQRDTEGPYGVLLYSNDDHNGAFDTNEDVIDSLSKQLESGDMMLRIGEFDSNYELMKRIAVFNDRYGEKEKISYIVLGAHGSEDSFGTGAFQSVDMNMLEGDGIKKMKSYFVENPEIVMASCSTGASSGIGQKISEVYDARVLAPKFPTSVKAINVSFDNDKKPHFSVQYREDDHLKIYKKGE